MKRTGLRAASPSLVATLLGAIVMPQSALAHSGDMHGLLAGFMHPWTGADHLLAMLAVGCWAAIRRNESLWALPLVALAGVAVGSCAAVAGPPLQVLEVATLLTVIALGLLIAAHWSVGLTVALAIAACCGSIHGYAHGMQIAQDGAPVWPATIGFVIATALLQLAGLLLCGSMLRNCMQPLVRAAGAAIAIAVAIVLAAG
jgi:urease accessory protein